MLRDLFIYVLRINKEIVRLYSWKQQALITSEGSCLCKYSGKKMDEIKTKFGKNPAAP